MLQKLSGIFILLLFSNCNFENNSNEILIQKIKIKNELCENCIGLKKIEIEYHFRSKHLFKKIYISKDSRILLLKKKKSNLDKKKTYNYLYVYDDIDLSRYSTLNEVKRDYKPIIYFNKLKISNNDFIFVVDKYTEIEYYLNGEMIDENDKIKMDKSSLQEVLFLSNYN